MNINARIATVLVAAAATVVADAPVQAHTTIYDSTIQITSVNSPPLRFGGLISSTKGQCFDTRRVDIVFGGEVVGTTKTDESGHYSVTSGTNEPGEYTVDLRKKVVRRARGHRHVCGRASDSYTR
jgi:hypothetical protein